MLIFLVKASNYFVLDVKLLFFKHLALFSYLVTKPLCISNEVLDKVLQQTSDIKTKGGDPLVARLSTPHFYHVSSFEQK